MHGKHPIQCGDIYLTRRKTDVSADCSESLLELFTCLRLSELSLCQATAEACPDVCQVQLARFLIASDSALWHAKNRSRLNSFAYQLWASMCVLGGFLEAHLIGRIVRLAEFR